MLRQGSDRIGHRAAPERPRLEGLDIKACDDAEIVRATFQGLVKIRRRGGIDINHVTVGKDKLVVDNVVTNEAKPTGEERYTSSSDKPPNTDTCYPASWNGKSLAIQLRINVHPTVSRTNACGFPISGDVDLLEGCQVDRHSAGLARSALLGCMSATLDAKLAFVAELGVLTYSAENKDSCGNILGRSGLYDTIRHNGFLLGRPKGGSGPFVPRREWVDNFGTQDIGQGSALNECLLRTMA